MFLGRWQTGLALAADLPRVLVGAMRHVVVGMPQPLVRVESLVEILPQRVGRSGVDQLPPAPLVDNRPDAAAGRVERYAHEIVLEALRRHVGRDVSARLPLGGDERPVAQRRQVPGHEPQRVLSRLGCSRLGRDGLSAGNLGQGRGRTAPGHFHRAVAGPGERIEDDDPAARHVQPPGPARPCAFWIAGSTSAAARRA